MLSEAQEGYRVVTEQRDNRTRLEVRQVLVWVLLHLCGGNDEGVQLRGALLHEPQSVQHCRHRAALHQDCQH